MSIYSQLLQELQTVKLIAVSKTKPASAIQQLYDQGQRMFGENKVQEMVEKYEQLPKDIEWHLIGHLQTNKVKYIAPFVAMIHSVDSLRLLQEINKEAAKSNRIIKVLLQLHIAKEETKFGLSMTEVEEILAFYSAPDSELKHVELCGVMGMATFTDNQDVVRSEFKQLHDIFLHIKNGYLLNKPSFCECSMGMSQDYTLAIEQGSTMVRIGSLLFGDRH
ncbi:MAG TPA: YggS family pyridoxal phosphate-dependent enzyme [Chitinophagaceae bacterium]|nr:YggS family pyridoxal phosphate-dependent enzyme [Chitinophagaceae bacterium]